MASIKPIEGRSVHQIQSGQVIVDLCSVVKELVENSIDAKTSSIEVRFKNSGLDSIEVQDNGNGIAPEDFDSIALKHYTSKLASYDDLASLNTFGFRGEALSSMCALSNFHVITARECDKPKGTRLEFETSGKVKSKTVVASTKGTTVAVEQLFKNLPVRRKELERNIKKEFSKVLSLLNAYACISTGVRFTVSNVVAKGKKNVVFSTQGHATTRENISNVFSAKAVASLIGLDLSFELQPSTLPSQSARNWSTQDDVSSREVKLIGHISRPVVGEGRQTPDRQMFFVNYRPCALPQVAKAINEVYRSYNVTQSPFVFANLVMDTNAYDVNVSPDKRTILLHDQAALLEALKASLTDLFESHDQSVPQGNTKLPTYKPLTVTRLPSVKDAIAMVDKAASKSAEKDTGSDSDTESGDEDELQKNKTPPTSMLRKFVGRATVDRESLKQKAFKPPRVKIISPEVVQRARAAAAAPVETTVGIPWSSAFDFSQITPLPRPVQDFNRAMGAVPVPREPKSSLTDDSESSMIDQSAASKNGPQDRQAMSNNVAQEGRNNDSQTAMRSREDPIIASQLGGKIPPSGGIQSALDKTRPTRLSEDIAVVTIGNITTTAKLGSPASKRRRADDPVLTASKKQLSTANPILLKSLRSFAAPGTQLEGLAMDEIDLAAAALPSAKIVGRSDMSNSEDLVDDELAASISEPESVEQADSDGEFIDDEEKKRREEAKVAQLVAYAEAIAARPTDDNMKRAASVLKSRARKDATLQIVQRVSTTIEHVRKNQRQLTEVLQEQARQTAKATDDAIQTSVSAEERLSLTVSKPDFARMNIVGQFNLGFILAVRPPDISSTSGSSSNGRNTDELFIIDQHASDEKYNFERLQAITVVQNQPLVHPKRLDLTAVDEEIIFNHSEALVKNGFKVDSDLSGEFPVGRRCRLISLPMSKEVVFDGRDFEELLSLLADHAGSDIPRPSKVRRMFAMRACRSSIMVGKTLTGRQMETVVRHMGEIDKPWNCPHGRPTMRHLYGLESWQGWQEGDGLAGMEEPARSSSPWSTFANDINDDDDDYEEDDSDGDIGDNV